MIEYRTIVEVVILLAAAIGGYKAKGVRRNSPSEPINNFSNPTGCKMEFAGDIRETKTRVGILEKNQEVLFKKVDKMADDVSFIRGKIDPEEG